MRVSATDDPENQRVREKSRIDPEVRAREKTSDRGKPSGEENREGEKPIALVRQAGSRWWACWLGYGIAIPYPG